MKVATTMVLLSTLVASSSALANNKERAFCGKDSPLQAQNLEGITKQLYKIVSGKAGEQRDWNLMKSLFAPNGSITPVFHTPVGAVIKPLSVDDFINLNKRIFANADFFETEVKAKVFRFGNSATILSQYESRDRIDGEAYSMGVNSFQLVNDGNRWCVISVTWDSDKGPMPTAHFELN